MTDDDLLRIAVDLIHTMMASASSENIRRIEWWSRARTALETAAQSSDSFASMVSVMGRKLQIDVTTKAGGVEIARLAAVVGADFEAFRRFCDRQALYCAAIAQSESDARKTRREAEAKAAGRDPDGLDNYTA